MTAIHQILFGWGGGAASLPASGLIGAWYADEYSLGSGTSIAYWPNSVASTPYSGNMVPGPIGRFSNSAYFTKSSCTAVDAAATGPLGASDASTLTAAGSLWYIAPVPVAPTSGSVFPAGNYTMGVNVRWRGTGNQQFKIGSYPSGLTTKTATSSWQRFSATWTSDGVAVSWPIMISADGSSAADFEIWGMNVFGGSSDLGPVAAETHIPVFARTGGWGPSNRWSKTSNGVDVSAADITGWLELGSLDLNAFTLIALAQRNGRNSGNDQYVSFLTDVTSGTSVALYGASDYKLGGQLGDSDPLPVDGAGGQARTRFHTFDRPTVNGYTTTTFSYDGTTAKLYSNDALMWSAQKTSGRPSVKGFLLGDNSFGTRLNSSIFAIALYNRALTQTEVIQSHAAIVSQAVGAGITVTENPVVAFAGDSFTQGYGDTSSAYNDGGYVNRAVIAASRALQGINYGASGYSIAGFITDYVTRLDAIIPSSKRGRKYCLHILFGANDLGSLSPAQFLTALDNFISARRSAGWDYIMVGTVLPRSLGVTPATWDSNRVTVNTGIRSRVGSTIDAVVDYGNTANAWGADGTWTVAGSYSDDGLHPNAATHASMAGLLTTALNAIP